MSTSSHTLSDKPAFQLEKYLPVLGWMRHYDRKHLSGDIIAGIIVAVMLVPQGMAYAMLAGLPPRVGLYASIVPLILYGLLGTSRVLAVGPVALVSLLVATGMASALPDATPEQYIPLALILAIQIGVIQLAMGVLRVGFLVNFLSHSVLSGFTSAAAIIIGFSQVKNLLGLEMPRMEHLHEQVLYTIEHIGQINPPTLFIGLLGVLILLFFKFRLAAVLRAIGLPEAWVVPLTKTGPLVIVTFGAVLVALTGWHETAGIDVVGDVPAGLPPLTLPVFDLDLWGKLFPVALTISLVSYMESISVARSLASKRRQKVDASQELIALGVANIGAAFTGGYPVTGGIARSVVNFAAGANTPLASLITAALVALTGLLLTPLFFHLPGAMLAAIIIVAVIGLVDWKTFRHTLAYSRADAISLGITFLAVLILGIEQGILAGVAVSMGLYLWRTSRPHVAIVGRVGETEHFRNVERHSVETHPGLLLVRVDESLYFPNAQFLEETILTLIADRPDVNHLVLVCSAVNYIDASALEVLESLVVELHDAGVDFHMAEVKGPVMDRLRRIGFIDEIGTDHIFLSTHQAVMALT